MQKILLLKGFLKKFRVFFLRNLPDLYGKTCSSLLRQNVKISFWLGSYWGFLENPFLANYTVSISIQQIASKLYYRTIQSRSFRAHNIFMFSISLYRDGITNRVIWIQQESAGQNQSFDDLSIGGFSIVYPFASALVLCLIDCTLIGIVQRTPKEGALGNSLQ